MTEQEYMDVGDLARVRAAMAIMSDICLFDNDAMRIAVMIKLRDIEEMLGKRIEILAESFSDD